METLKKIALILIVATTSLNAQQNNGKALSKTEDGVFRTYKDFETRHFTDSVDVSKPNNSEKDNFMDKVVIKEGKYKRKYSEGEIYGYALNGKEYRYFDGKKVFAPYGYFEILEVNGLVVYRQTEPNKSGGDAEYFYYSKDLNSPIKSLTRRNLKYELNNKEYVTSIFSLKNISSTENGSFAIVTIYNQYKNKPSNI